MIFYGVAHTKSESKGQNIEFLSNHFDYLSKKTFDLMQFEVNQVPYLCTTNS